MPDSAAMLSVPDFLVMGTSLFPKRMHRTCKANCDELKLDMCLVQYTDAKPMSNGSNNDYM